MYTHIGIHWAIMDDGHYLYFIFSVPRCFEWNTLSFDAFERLTALCSAIMCKYYDLTISNYKLYLLPPQSWTAPAMRILMQLSRHAYTRVIMFTLHCERSAFVLNWALLYETKVNLLFIALGSE